MTDQAIPVSRNRDVNIVIELAKKSLETAIQNVAQNPILILVSGGSALTLLHNFSPQTIGEQTTISVLDERYTSEKNARNFSQLEKTNFFAFAKERKCSFFNPYSHNDVKNSGAQFHSFLKDWKERYVTGHIIITQGIGTDGHTAGILPYPENQEFFHLRFDTEALAIGYDTKEKTEYSQRITVTLPFLRSVDHAIIYLIGNEKQAILERVLYPTEDLHQLPARIIHEMPHVQIHTSIL
jgi:6-phosphogluconolactonase/glucosamine-6-phosphate isomerase/deaminase